MTDRGQTANDYLIGIIIVLVTIFAVFGFFPSIFTPFEEPVTSDEETMADNLANTVIDTHRTMNGERTLNFTQLETNITTTANLETIKEQSGIPDWKQINVTVRTGPTETPIMQGGDTTGNAVTATTVRNIRAQDSTSGSLGENCGDGCKLVVRVG